MNPLASGIARVLDIEREIGSPWDATRPLSFARAVEHDDSEEFPRAAVTQLLDLGFGELQVPVEHGGRAVDIVDGLELFRLLARRDATVATALATTSLAYMPVWIAGTDDQRRRWAAAVCRGEAFSWALSERAHGSDILATAVTATPVPGGWAIDGEKWPIGNAGRGRYVSVFAQTGARRGPGAFSVLVVDREEVGVGAVRAAPRERLYGVRGIDLGGLMFDGCVVPADAVVGGEGRGLELALQSAYPARVLASAVALGCADTGLRLVLEFAEERELFGRRIVDAPCTARDLAASFADLVAADAVAVAAARTLQAAPHAAALVSSVTKFWVPTLLERTMTRLATVLGARHYLRSDPRFGMFGKAMRDLWVAHFAEGNTLVNLKNVAVGLSAVLAEPSESAELRAGIDCDLVFGSLDTELPPFAPWSFDLRVRGTDPALVALPDAVRRLWALARADGTDDGPAARRRTDVARAAECLVSWRDALIRDHRALADDLGPAHLQSVAAYDLAERYCALHAAACVVQWAARPDPAGHNTLGAPAVALLVLRALLPADFPGRSSVADDGALVGEVLAFARTTYVAGRAFSLRALPLAESADLAASVPAGRC